MDVVLELPEDLRGELKAPLGPIYTDAERLLADAGEPIVCVGDIVTYHLLVAGHHPHVALIDGKTKRERVERKVLDAIQGFDHQVEVENPPAVLTLDLLDVLASAVSGEGTTVVQVVGEEDLAALPAVLAAPTGASVVYGQPDEGMVLAAVNNETQTKVRALLDRFEGDHETAYAVLGQY